MKALFCLVLISHLVRASSWFSTEPAYTKWSDGELRTWLEHHNIRVPAFLDKAQLYDLVDANWQSKLAEYDEAGRHWSLDQFSRARHAFQHIKDDTFDTWDESRLRVFLLEQGVVAPEGPRKQLVLLAKAKYRSYTDAAALYSSIASASASSVYAGATDAAHSASQSVRSVAAQAAHEVARAFDDTKDHVYSSWDESYLRNWLEEHGVIEAKRVNTKDELTRLANDYYREATSAAWESWSDSYIREWLIAHNLLKPTDMLSRPSLLEEMKKYYYNYTDNVWNTWSNFELKAWLVNHGILKSDAERNRDELARMVGEHYLSAPDCIWAAWTDSDLREWLAERGYLEGRSEVKHRRDLVDLISVKYPDASAKATPYLAWPDARLRAYLRERGIDEDTLPTDRPGLLQETRIRWVQSVTWTEATYARLKEIINDSVKAAEEEVARILEFMSGHSRNVARTASEKVGDVYGYGDAEKTHTQNWGLHKGDQAREGAEDMRQRASEGVAQGKKKVQVPGDEL